MNQLETLSFRRIHDDPDPAKLTALPRFRKNFRLQNGFGKYPKKSLNL